ncbi:MAG: hypothetical protein IKV14_03825 [Muribaculaceae bacterium]|nr:hypothetical protein [Muribaculaceae bacterium]
MKNSLFKILMLLAIFASNLTFVSCNGDGNDSDDKNGLVAPDKTVTDVSIAYSINLADTYYKYFDIKAEYVNKESQIISMDVTQNWDYSFSSSYEATPKNIIFKVVATPKEELPTIEEINYDITANIHVTQTGYTKEGIENENFGYSGSCKINGYKTPKEWTNYTSKERTLINYDFPIGPANPVE